MVSVSRFIAAVGALSALSLYAAPSNDDLQREIDQLKMRVDRMSEGSSLHSDKTADAPTGYGVYLSADAIFWQTQGDTTQYSERMSQNVPASARPQDNIIENQSIDWTWGFKVGAGYTFDHDNWKLAGEYTWFRPDGTSRDSYGNGASGGYNPIYTGAVITSILSDTTSM